MNEFELAAAKARLEAAARQINKRLEAIETTFENGKGDGHLKAEEINLYLLLSTVTGKPNKYIEF
ncbi:hypothetical protein [Bacillus sp. COPE52]|uniref:hypothetical protein n=1 Tax=Bacillus sp. COPE52 TaxID=2233998 RepID=UPI000E0FFDE8|nr:hypothetical protein [Bacillus sp. COPE52]AXK19160.1 hypothetical protein DPQ31_16250 [Bacillus sp. COPE52]